MIRVTLAVFRMLIFGLAVMSYFVTTAPLLPFYYVWPNPTRKVLIGVLQSYCRFCLWFMGIKVSPKILDNRILRAEGELFVCNHLSYLDVIILAARVPACFVTSVEIKKTPFLGQLCILAGCVFVERRNKNNIHGEIAELTEALEAGINIMLFPEATSTNGQEVLRFKRPLFQASIDAQKSIIPMTLNYLQVNNEKVSQYNRDQIFWYGEMTFLDHLWGVFRCKQISVSLTADSYLAVANELTSDLAQSSHAIVASHYKPIRAV